MVSVRFLYLFSKIRGFPGTHGTHANYATDTRERLLFKQTFFCNGALLFPCLQLYFTEHHQSLFFFLQIIFISFIDFWDKFSFQSEWSEVFYLWKWTKKIFLTFHVKAVSIQERLIFKKNFLALKNAVSIWERSLKQSDY